MIKQWYNQNLKLYYIYLPSEGNKILTSDGVLMTKDEFSTLSAEKYVLAKATRSNYDYNKSRVQEILVKKNFMDNKIMNVVERTDELKKTEDSETKECVVKKNLFDFVYPKLMIILVVFCSCLSIYFTRTHLLKLQNAIIAFAISFSMFIYGLIGSQMCRRAFKMKKRFKGFVYGITSIAVIGYSMYSSLDVNYSKYMKLHEKDNESVAIMVNTTNRYNRLLKDKSRYELEIEEQRKQNTVDMGNVWNDDLKKYVWSSVGTTSLTKDAKEKITYYEKKISEINEELTKLENEGVIEDSSNIDKNKSLTDLTGDIFHVSGNIIQMIFLLIPSMFIDLIGVLSISIYTDKFEKKEE